MPAVARREREAVEANEDGSSIVEMNLVHERGDGSSAVRGSLCR